MSSLVAVSGERLRNLASSPVDQLISATFATCSAPRAGVPARAGSFFGPMPAKSSARRHVRVRLEMAGARQDRRCWLQAVIPQALSCKIRSHHFWPAQLFDHFVSAANQLQLEGET